MRFRTLFLCLAVVSVCGGSASAHEHGGPSNSTKQVQRPTVFLDKSPRIVEYQLKRLSNQRLLLVDRKSDDAKYIPVYSAILRRTGMSPQYREEAVEALGKLQASSPTEVLLAALAKLDSDDRQLQRTFRQLVGMLLGQGSDLLSGQVKLLQDAIDSPSAMLRSAGFAGLVVAGAPQSALNKAKTSESLELDWLLSISLIPDADQRSALRQPIVSLIKDSESTAIKRAAIDAIALVPVHRDETFDLIAPLFANANVRASAVRTMLKIPADQRGEGVSARLAGRLVEHAEATPPKDRTSDQFVDAMLLADQLMVKVPTGIAKSYRARLGAVTVRVVRIRTVEEEMRYDLEYFAVEAGRSVQIVLENHDLMPHNLVVTTPDALKEVAQLGLETGPHRGWQGLPYVPESEKVLFATPMVPADGVERLTFTAPTEPGEYPFVCTFPQHWYRMYGVMVVVEDLDAWLKNPIKPGNPIGSNRSHVHSWKVDDLKAELESGLLGRTTEIGKKLFAEASCLGCHKVLGEGGVIGPELTDVFARWKGDRLGVLREILNPSHKVDAKYAMQRILTVDGRTITGVLLKEDDDNVTLLTNPEAKEPTVIPQDDIEAMVASPLSMMPKALLDQYTKDEIFELMSYLESIDPKN